MAERIFEPGLYEIGGKDYMLISNEDLCKAISEVAGVELGAVIANVIQRDYKEIERIEREVESDCDIAYEEVEHLTSKLMDIIETLENVIEELDKSRVNKARLKKAVEEELKDIRSNYI